MAFAVLGAPGGFAPAAVGALAGAPTQAQIDAVALPGMDAIVDGQLPRGTFEDPIRGVVGQGGLTRVVWVALHQAERLRGEEAEERVRLARKSLSLGTEGTQLLPKWPIALLVEEGLQRFLVNPDPLLTQVQMLGKLHASGVADACYQRPGCFNNYRLTSEVLNLELARTGVHSSVPGARLANPGLWEQTLEWLGSGLPRSTSETATVRGRTTVFIRTAAALSDPDSYPLAYQAFCAAMLTRAAVLAGAALPGAAWRLQRDALWELVGMTAPDGEISWLGRGQDEVWTLAAALYAGVQGSTLMAHRDPALATRLRRLAGIEMAALQARLGPDGLRTKPTADTSPAGLDGYASAIGNASLALVWLELARDAAPAAVGATAKLPSEQGGGSSEDARGNGLLTLRRGRVWLGVHRVSDGGDPRLGWGLLRAMRLSGDGRWVSLLPERPIARPGQADFPSGPTLVHGGRVSAPVVASGGVKDGAIELKGVWRGGAGIVTGDWVWKPAGGEAQLTTNCPRGASLRFTEWLPREGRLTRGVASLARDGFRVRFSSPVSVAALRGSYASAREQSLGAYRVAVRCSGAPVSVFWSGKEITSA
jgi:hypothetical protein